LKKRDAERLLKKYLKVQTMSNDKIREFFIAPPVSIASKIIYILQKDIMQKMK